MTVKLTINNLVSKGQDKLDLSDSVFGAEFNEPLVHQIVIAYQAGGRAGTRAQKNRAAVRGGGSKPWRQKGSGRARAGTIRSPIFRGGGVVHPASNKDFSQKVNRKMYRVAMRAIWSELCRQNRLIVIDELDMERPSTKTLAAKLSELGVTNTLLMLHSSNQNIELSARNLAHVLVCFGGRVDPVSLISHENVVATVDAIKQVDEVLQ